MKWERLYDNITTTVVAIWCVSITTDVVFPFIINKNNKNTVKISMQNSGALTLRGASGFYDPVFDEIVVCESGPDDVIAHELKHADNAVKFKSGINMNAEEISACAAECLCLVEKYERSLVVADSLISHSNIPILPEFKQKLDSMGIKNPREILRQRSVVLLSPFCPISTEQDTPVEITERGNLVELRLKIRIKSKFDIVNGEKKSIPRDVNYDIWTLNATNAGGVLNYAVNEWQKYNNWPVYIPYRFRLIRNNYHILDDKDLEKLFTFKINGAHRSLYKDADLKTRQRVKDACNANNVAYMFGRKFQR